MAEYLSSKWGRGAKWQGECGLWFRQGGVVCPGEGRGMRSVRRGKEVPPVSSDLRSGLWDSGRERKLQKKKEDKKKCKESNTFFLSHLYLLFACLFSNLSSCVGEYKKSK